MMFPSRPHLNWNYPKYKTLPLPIAWVARWFSLLGKRDVVKSRYSQMKDVTDDSVEAYRKSLQFVGLEVRE